MNKWFFAYLRVKERTESEIPFPFDEDKDATMIFNFIEQYLSSNVLMKGNGKFDRAFRSIESTLSALDSIVFPNFQGDSEWFPLLLGLRAGLMISRHQLSIIKKR